MSELDLSEFDRLEEAVSKAADDWRWGTVDRLAQDYNALLLQQAPALLERAREAEKLSASYAQALESLRLAEQHSDELAQQVRDLEAAGVPCECGVEQACQFVREREAALAECNQLRALLREARANERLDGADVPVPGREQDHEAFLLHLARVVWASVPGAESYPAADQLLRVIQRACETFEGA